MGYDELRRLLTQRMNDDRPLDGLVCVAADLTRASMPSDELSSWWPLFHDVVIATDTLTRAALEFLGPGSRIVFVLSQGAVDAEAEAPPRAAAMAGCRNLMQSWALTLAPAQINVNAICVAPALVGERDQRGLTVSALHFLLSDQSRDVTGQTLSVGGGP